MSETFVDKLRALSSPATRSFILTFIQGEHECRGSIEACATAGNDECIVCGERDCPHGEPLHFHHDGCQACVFDEPKNK